MNASKENYGSLVSTLIIFAIIGTLSAGCMDVADLLSYASSPPGKPSLVLTGHAQMTQGACQAFVVERKFNSVSASNNTATDVISLSSSSMGSFYNDAGCTEKIIQTSIVKDTSSSTFYFMPSVPGSEMISANGVKGSLVSSSLMLTVHTPAVLQFDKGSLLDLGRVYVETNTSVELKVTNQGGTPATAVTVQSPVSDNMTWTIASNTCDHSINSGDSCVLTLDALPTDVGPISAQISMLYFDGAAFRSTSLSVSGNVVGLPGTLDTSFAVGGKFYDVNSPPVDVGPVAIQPDNKILILSHTLTSSPTRGFLKRLLADGTLDPSFNGNGTVDLPLYHSRDLTLQPDGKILVCGTSDDAQVFVARILPDGSADFGFGENGVARFPLNNLRSGGDQVGVQPNGNILVAGSALVTSQGGYTAQLITILRFLPDGAVDTTFGSNGRIQIDRVSIRDDTVQELLIQPDGRFLVAGYARNVQMRRQTGPIVLAPVTFLIFRFEEDGSLDTSFGTLGRVFTPIPARECGDCVHLSYAYGQAAAVQPDGKIVVAGYYSPAQLIYRNGGIYIDHSHYDTAITRYHSDGKLDLSFGEGGIARFGSPTSSYASGIAVQPDGKLITAGYAPKPNYFSTDHQVLRFNEDGILDSSFNGSGEFSYSVSSGEDYAETVAIAPDGKIVTVGTDAAYKPVVLRLWP